VTDYSALRAVTQTFRVLLRRHITDSTEADLAGVQIDLRSPRQLAQANVTTAVSLWLYRVTVQPDMLNAPVVRTDDTYARRPLPLDLSYLITALHTQASAALSLTGRVLQVVNDHPRLRGADLQETLADTDAELRLSIEATTLSESSNLWYSLQAPFQLAVPVRLQVAVIESHHAPYQTSPVLTRPAQMSEIVS
jgi:hypothetical protein